MRRRPHTTRGIKKERELFAALNRLTNQDEHFKLEQEHSPPTILQYLLAKGTENSQRLLDEALKIRDEPASRRYRKWHRKVRDAWARGHRDANAEAELDAVTKELQNRISGKPTVVTKIKVQGELRGEAKVGVDLGLGKASVSARGKVSVNPKDIVFKVPTRMRNWFVDKLVLSRHQKLLLEMSLDRRSFDDLAYGLKTVWAQS
jgi:hypothetical protein